jgi:hypothetical protein
VLYASTSPCICRWPHIELRSREVIMQGERRRHSAAFELIPSLTPRMRWLKECEFDRIAECPFARALQPDSLARALIHLAVQARGPKIGGGCPNANAIHMCTLARASASIVYITSCFAQFPERSRAQTISRTPSFFEARPHACSQILRARHHPQIASHTSHIYSNLSTLSDGLFALRDTFRNLITISSLPR